MAKVTQLRKWLAPSVPYTISLEDQTGKFEHSFKLCFDFNALSLVEKYLGVNLLEQFSAIFNINATSVSIFFWAAAQAYQPEYGVETSSTCPTCGQERTICEGLDVIRSFFTIGNFEPAALAVQEAFKLSLNPDQRKIVEAAVAAAIEVAARAAAGAKSEVGGEPPLVPTATTPATA